MSAMDRFFMNLPIYLWKISENVKQTESTVSFLPFILFILGVIVLVIYSFTSL